MSIFQTNTKDPPCYANHILSNKKKTPETKGIFFLWSNGIMTKKLMTSPRKNMKPYRQEPKKSQKERNKGSGGLTNLEQTYTPSYSPSAENLSFLSSLIFFIHGKKINKAKETLKVHPLPCWNSGLLFTLMQTTLKKVKETLSKDKRTPHPIAQQLFFSCK